MEQKPFYTTTPFYLIMTAIYLGILATVFTYATQYLQEEIHETFSYTESTHTAYRLNDANYALLKTKLDLPDVAPTESTTDTSTSSDAVATTSAETATPAFDQNALYQSVISVENATNIAGLAGRVTSFLEDNSFTNTSAANATETTDTHIIRFKSDNTALREAFVNTLPADLQTAQIESLSSDSPNDIVIILAEDVSIQ